MKIMRRMEDVREFRSLGHDFFKVMEYYRDYGPNFQYASLEHYDFCSYRCIYCITESQGKTRARFDRQNLQQYLKRELEVLNHDWVICLGAAMDPYNELETDLQLTRLALELIKEYRYRFTVTTKGTGIIKDLDFFQNLDKDQWFKLAISISVLDESSQKRLEPNAPSTQERIETAITLYEAGLPEVWLTVAPWIPEVTDLEAIFELLPEGMPVNIQPLDLGDEFEETLDGKSRHFSSKVTLGKQWTFDEINAHYIQECNRLYNEYIGKFPRMEWRWPIFRETHNNERGYFRQLKPGDLEPDHVQ